MNAREIPADLQSFILRSIPSPSFFEGIMLLRLAPEQMWDSHGVAQRLYIDEQRARVMLSEMNALGVAVSVEQNRSFYRYEPSSETLQYMLDRLVDVYFNSREEFMKLARMKAE